MTLYYEKKFEAAALALSLALSPTDQPKAESGDKASLTRSVAPSEIHLSTGPRPLTEPPPLGEEGTWIEFDPTAAAPRPLKPAERRAAKIKVEINSLKTSNDIMNRESQAVAALTDQRSVTLQVKQYNHLIAVNEAKIEHKEAQLAKLEHPHPPLLVASRKNIKE